MAQGSGRSKGTVKWYDEAKGFDHITPENGDEDLFVHVSSIKSDGFKTLVEGQVVEFSVIKGDGGRANATDVTVPDGGSVQGGGGSE